MNPAAGGAAAGRDAREVVGADKEEGCEADGGEGEPDLREEDEACTEVQWPTGLPRCVELAEGDRPTAPGVPCPAGRDGRGASHLKHLFLVP